jgi:glycosyltransferase involved in cell wall biosynthesis
VSGTSAAPVPTVTGAEVNLTLVLEFDLSLSTGYSINERESAVALLDQFPDQVSVICPRPAFPEVFHDPRIHYVSKPPQGYHPVSVLRFVSEVRAKVRELSLDRPPDALVFRLGPLPLLSALAVRDGTPVILKKLAGYSLFSRPDRSLRRRLLASASLPLYRYVARRALGADTESHAYMEWLPSAFGISRSALTMIPNGANTRDFFPQDRDRSRANYGLERFDHIVGYVGALDDLRCIPEAIDAMRLLKDISGLALVLVGDGPTAGIVKDRVLRAGLAERVVLTGFLPYREIPQIMSAFDVAIDLTRVPLEGEDGTVYGSYSQKIAQYLSCGVPVVAWDTKDTAFLVDEEVGRTAEIGNVQALARAVREALSMNQMRSDVARMARQVACDQLSSEVLASRRMALWTDLCRADGFRVNDEAGASP